MIKFYQTDFDYNITHELWQEIIDLEGISLFGNRDFTEHFSEKFEAVRDMLKQYLKDGETIQDRVSDYITWSTSHLTIKNYEKLQYLIEHVDKPEEEAYNILTNEKWHIIYLKGYCQSDWIKCHCPKNFNTKILEDLYFNLGYTYDGYIDDSENVIDVIYVPLYEDTKNYLQSLYPNEDVKIFAIEGYMREPIYQELL